MVRTFLIILGCCFNQSGHEFFHRGFEFVEIRWGGVDIVHRQDDMLVVFGERIDEWLLVETVTFAYQSFGAVAVDGVVQFPFRGHDEDLHARRVDAGLYMHPADAQREKQLAVGRAVELLYEQFATELFVLAEAILFVGVVQT